MLFDFFYVILIYIFIYIFFANTDFSVTHSKSGRANARLLRSVFDSAFFTLSAHKPTDETKENELIQTQEKELNTTASTQSVEQSSSSVPPVVPKGGKAYLFFKRVFDVVFSFLAIVVLFPFMLVIGLIVVLTSKGPMIYVSERVGKGGKVFKFLKFRSMYADADERLDDLLKNNEIDGGVTFKMKDDPRITPFGKFIRRTSIDELPQLFNILVGDMSFVGPRPGTVREYALYSEKDKQRLLVPQGLTGEWQVHGRSKTTFERMIEMDLSYIADKQSLIYDLKLIFMTFVVVFKKEGAQ